MDRSTVGLAEVRSLFPQQLGRGPALHVVEGLPSRLMLASERMVRRVAPLAAAVLLVGGMFALGQHDRRVEVQVVDHDAHVYNLTSPPQTPRYFGPAPG